MAPELPDTVLDISESFNSAGIIDAPTITQGVITMGSTFQNCSSMKKASNIPNGVIDLQGTFQKYCLSICKLYKFNWRNNNWLWKAGRI